MSGRRGMTETTHLVVEAFKKFERSGQPIFYPDRVLGWCLRNIEWIVVAPLTLLLAISLTFPAHDFLYLRIIFYPDRFCVVECNYEADLKNTIWIVSATLTVLIGGLLFRATLKRTAKGLTYLAASGQLLPNPECMDCEWADFASCFERKIRSRWRWALIGASLAVVAVYIGWWVYSRRWAPDMRSLPNIFGTVGTVSEIMLAPALLVFLSATMAWVLLVIGTAIRELTPAYRLVIIPQHPDESGGLASLGDITFGMVLPITAGIILFSIFFLVGFLPLLMLVGLLFLVPLVFLVFLWPLWDVHEIMVEERAKYRDDLVEQIVGVETLLRQRLQLDVEEPEGIQVDETLAELRERLETLNQLLPNAKTYPVWPFSKRVAVRILSQNSLPPLFVVLLKVAQLRSWEEFLNFITQSTG